MVASRSTTQAPGARRTASHAAKKVSATASVAVANRDQQGVGDQPDMIGGKYGAIVVQRDARERGHAERLIERQQRDPGEHRDRHEEKQQEIEHQDPGCCIAQPPEIERARPKALAGDGRESLRVPRQPAVDG
jgi:hypothetical protein